MNIYVGNLEHQVTEDELKLEFENFGEVSSVKIIKDMYTGESKGFGFVEMPDSANAKTAMSELNGKEIKGRAIRVDEARQRNNRDRGRRNNRGFGSSRGGYGGGRRGY
ncbi:RNA-binding protein [candidate division KSB1 bacterium]|nr:RNA-binding protein [candidate division KSB1 bacterium]